MEEAAPGWQATGTIPEDKPPPAETTADERRERGERGASDDSSHSSTRSEATRASTSSTGTAAKVRSGADSVASSTSNIASRILSDMPILKVIVFTVRAAF